MRTQLGPRRPPHRESRGPEGGSSLQPTSGDRGPEGLLERERELAQLDASIADACSGAGRFLVVEASAGLGKTRLLKAARDRAPAAMRILTARGTELERSLPFALVRQLFEPPVSAMAGTEREALFDGAAAAARSVVSPSRAEQGHETRVVDGFSVLHGLYWLTAAFAEHQPLLLVVDDVHWADDSSLDLLTFLLPRLEELPLLLIAACRPAEPGAPLGALRLTTDPVAGHMNPQPLSRQATRALIATELRSEPDDPFVAECHAVSGGNPFLLTELLRALSAQSVVPSAAQASAVREIAPDRIARTVRMRLNGLSPHARTVARSLAILGDDSEHGLLAALDGLDAAQTLNAADELRAAALLDPGEPLRFIHPLVRTAVYANIPAGERTASHVAAATLLQRRGATPERLAGHLLLSDAHGSRETVKTLLDAGARALAHGTPRAAIAYLRRALREPPPAELRADVLQALIVAGIRASDHALHDAIEPEILAELEANPPLLSRWARLLAVWLALGGHISRAVPLLERAIDAALREQVFKRAFRTEAQLLTFARVAPAEAKSRLARYRDGIEPGSADERLAAAFDSAWCLVHGEAGQGVAFARLALRDGKLFAEQPELMAPGWTMMALVSADALDDAQRAAEQALDIARERGAAPELVGAWLLHANTAAARGDLAAAEADRRQALHIARLGGMQTLIPNLATSLAIVLIDRGAIREAARELEAFGEADQLMVWFAVPGLARGRLLLAQGRLKQAADQLLAVQRRLEEWGVDGLPYIQARLIAARALAGLGDHAQAAELAEQELVHARRWGASSPLARAYRALALTKKGPDGIALLEQAVALLETSPAILQRAEALAELGSALRRARRRAEAREPLREALQLARQCGAAALARHAHGELQAAGATVRRYVPVGVESLTASERRVAEMAASGMTNREIAQTLFLTVKTIETHLSHAYEKLGIGSRRLLPDALSRAGAGVTPDRSFPC
ncbi:MAG TPA: AAA family ATPase [Conexibacter sp.]|nr:AAA family ATPase [Conexibacter sp.]